MRGTPVQDYSDSGGYGIIPAYAGNTSAMQAPIHWQWDHPRVCGEHKITAGGASMEAGSSPRMRGTHRLEKRRIVVIGIIPAYAGNTLRDYSNFVVSKFMSFVFHLV